MPRKRPEQRIPGEDQPGICTHTWLCAHPESTLSFMRSGAYTGAGGSSESENVNVIVTSLIASDIRLGKI